MSDIFEPADGVLPTEQDLSPPESDDTTAHYGEDYKFDFLLGDLVTDEDGHVVLISGAEAVAQSIEKSLRTPRLEHLAYSPEYGNEMELALANPPIGTTPADLALSYAVECIDSDPRVESMDDIDAVVVGSTAQITGTILTTFGEIIDLDVTLDI